MANAAGSTASRRTTAIGAPRRRFGNQRIAPADRQNGPSHSPVSRAWS